MSPLTGSGSLIRLIGRRDRVWIPVWVVGTVGLVLAQASSFSELYPTAADRQERAQLIDNPAFALFLGGGHGLDEYTYGAMVANELGPLLMLIVSVMSIMMVARHTRAEEEAGRTELIRANVVGRHATAFAALVVVVGMNVAIGALLTVGLPSIGEYPGTGALAMGAAVCAAGLVFTGVALVAAQITEYGRAGTGIALATLGGVVALKAAGSIADTGIFTWGSPLGWSEEVRPFVDERWWPLLLSLGAFAALVSVAVALSARRDVGGGLLAPGLGRPRAARSLATPIGLAVRLQRASVIGWAAPLLLFGLLFGGVAEEMAEFAEDNDFVRDYLQHAGSSDLIDGAIAVYLGFFAVIASAFAVQAVTVLRREESALRAEAVLATATSRARFATSHLLVALVGSLVLLTAAGLGYGIARAVSAGDIAELPKMLGAMLAYAPAMWVLAAIATAVYGVTMRLGAAPWAMFGFVLLTGWIGPLVDLPDWVYNLSPFEHVPSAPAQELTVVPLLLLTAVSAALIAAGLVAFRRRDLQTG